MQVVKVCDLHQFFGDTCGEWQEGIRRTEQMKMR